MTNETLESELKSQLDRWSREDLQLVQRDSERRTGNTLSFQRRDPGVTVLTLDQKRVVEIVGDAEITDDPFRQGAAHRYMGSMEEGLLLQWLVGCGALHDVPLRQRKGGGQGIRQTPGGLG